MQFFSFSFFLGQFPGPVPYITTIVTIHFQQKSHVMVHVTGNITYSLRFSCFSNVCSILLIYFFPVMHSASHYNNYKIKKTYKFH